MRPPRGARALLALAVLVQLVVLYAPRAPSTGGVPHLDKVVHLGVFAAVALAGRWAHVPVRPLVAVLLGHAVVSELLQHWVLPQRSGDPLDALADAAGVLLGVLLGVLVGRPVGRLGRWRTGRASAARRRGSTAGR